MLGAAVPQLPQELKIDDNNVGESMLPIGDRMSVRVVCRSERIGAALQKLYTDKVNWIERLKLPENAIRDDDEAEQLSRIIMENRVSLKSIGCNLCHVYAHPKLTDQGGIKVLKALSLCPNLEDISIAVSENLLPVQRKLVDVVFDRNKIAKANKSLQQNQEELSQLISQAEDQVRRNNN